ncbi:MAG: hypothetical protein ACRCUM_02795, partial [Mycoplasmoidaceae bacterium]
ENKAISNLPLLTSKFNTIVDELFTPLRYDEFRLLLFEAKYFCNIVPLYTTSAKLNRAISKCKFIAFLYGVSCIYKVGNSFIPCYIKQAKKSITGEYVYLELATAESLLSSYGDNTKIDTTFKLQLADIENDVVIMRWDELCFGAYYTFLPFIKLESNLLDMLTTEGFSLIKKFNYQASSPSVIRDEMKNFFNPKSPWNISCFLEDELKSRLSQFDLGNKEKNQFLEYFEFTMNVYYSKLGRRFNVDTKPERNVSGEVEASQSNFDILEQGHRMEMENFRMELFNKYGIEVHLQRIKMEDEEKDIENEDITDNL